MASPVFGLRWAPDGSALYAMVERDGVSAIYRWEPDRGASLSGFAPGAALRARVVENVTACTVDATCYLTLRLADTTIQATYGHGERPAPPCPISVEVSDLAFELEEGDAVEVELEPCEAGYVLQGLRRR